MPKTITQTVRNLLAQATGTEPIIVVGIDWSNIGLTQWYATKEIQINDLSCRGNILQVGNLVLTKRADGLGTAGTISFSMFDGDGHLKSIMDQRQLEKAQAVVYQYYVGTTKLDMLELLRGQVVGPASWDEGRRIVNFEIETHVESNEFGFSATREDFSDMNPAAEDVAWPAIFGTVRMSPALHVRASSEGLLEYGIWLRFPNPIHKRRNCKYKNSKGVSVSVSEVIPNDPPIVVSNTDDGPIEQRIFFKNHEHDFPLNTTIKISINGVIFKGKLISRTEFVVEEANLPKYENLPIGSREESLSDYYKYKVLWLAEDDKVIENHLCVFEDGGCYWVNFCYLQEGRKCYFQNDFERPSDMKSMEMEGGSIAKVGVLDPSGMSPHSAMLYDQLLKSKRMTSPFEIQSKIALLEQIKNEQDAWRADPDTRILRVDENPELYIASITPMSEITAVYGKRKIQTSNGQTKTIIQRIPKDYYEVKESNYPVNGNLATGIEFKIPLKYRAGEDWDDEVYVDAKSSIGPNPVDVIGWILANYTSLSTNSSSFNHAHSRLNGFECNFTLTEKSDALRLAHRIAYENRSALFIDSGQVFFNFLDERPSAVLILDEDSVEMDTLQFYSSGTAEIKTKLTAEWLENYRGISLRQRKHAYSENIDPIRRYNFYYENLDAYGLKEEREKLISFNRVDEVLAFLGFWGPRFANSWKRIKLRSFMPCLILQIFDAVQLNFARSDLANLNYLAIVESLEYNFTDKSISLDLWLPSVVGENTEYPHLWSS